MFSFHRTSLLQFIFIASRFGDQVYFPKIFFNDVIVSVPMNILQNCVSNFIKMKF